MHNSRKASSYMPHIYDGFGEMNKLISIDDINLDTAEKALNGLMDNQWIVTANEEGIKNYERMFGIVADTSKESLQFRRERLINRFSNRMPFTVSALKQKLNAIIGADNYSLTIDYDKYIIYLQSSISNQIWYTETMLTISGMKPCNMVFVNNPLISSNIYAAHTIYLSNVTNNYTLGENFKLGMSAFSIVEDEKVIKMSSTPSFTDGFLERIATFTADSIASMTLKGEDGRSSIITEFAVKVVTDNLITIEYDVPTSLDTPITSIEVYDNNAVMLASSTVYIPVSSSIRIKHTLLVKEG